MSNSIFDWDDEDDEKQEEPAALIPYEPSPAEAEPPDQPEPLSHQEPPSEDTAWKGFDEPAGRPEPAPFQYSSDPFAPPPPPAEQYSDPFSQRADHVEAPPEPATYDPGLFGYGANDFSSSPVPAENDQYPFGYQPEPFAPLPPPLEFQPESREETSRRGGLAFSAGIVFFSSVVFMLFLGWIADWLIGSSPWGLVGGIVLGSLIGLVQFVRITSRIFNSGRSESAIHPLLPPDDER